jgi:hypothetical protein
MPAWRISSEGSSPEKLSCQPKTRTLTAIRATVRTGNREVGTLSLRGNKAAASLEQRKAPGALDARRGPQTILKTR